MSLKRKRDFFSTEVEAGRWAWIENGYMTGTKSCHRYICLNSVYKNGEEAISLEVTSDYPPDWDKKKDFAVDIKKEEWAVLDHDSKALISRCVKGDYKDVWLKYLEVGIVPKKLLRSLQEAYNEFEKNKARK